jgi:hypothetical protein
MTPPIVELRALTPRHAIDDADSSILRTARRLSTPADYCHVRRMLIIRRARPSDAQRRHSHARRAGRLALPFSMLNRTATDTLCRRCLLRVSCAPLSTMQ